MKTPKHLRFEQFTPSKPRKTKCWNVVNKHDDFTLGVISWFAKWRKYAFYPDPQTIYEEDCLVDIADFCIEQTRFHKQGLKV